MRLTSRAAQRVRAMDARNKERAQRQIAEAQTAVEGGKEDEAATIAALQYVSERLADADRAGKCVTRSST